MEQRMLLHRLIEREMYNRQMFGDISLFPQEQGNMTEHLTIMLESSEFVRRWHHNALRPPRLFAFGLARSQ